MSMDTKSDDATKNAHMRQEWLQRAKLARGIVCAKTNVSEFGDLCAADAKAALRAALEACDEINYKFEDLKRTIMQRLMQARAYSVDDEFIYAAEKKLQLLESEGEHGRYI